MKFVCAPLSVTSFLSGAPPSLEEFWILIGTQHTQLSSPTFITFFATQMPCNPNKPRFSRCDVYSGKPLIDIFTLPYLLIWGMVLHRRQCLMEHTVIIFNLNSQLSCKPWAARFVHDFPIRFVLSQNVMESLNFKLCNLLGREWKRYCSFWIGVYYGTIS